MRTCRFCGDDLFIGRNWTKQRKLHYDYTCDRCCSLRSKRYYRDNTDAVKARCKVYREKYPEKVFNCYRNSVAKAQARRAR